MRTVRALGKLLMLEDDGCINAPMSFFVNLDSNPNTQESKARSLKLLHKFLSHFKVPLADRALEGRCLEDREINGLVHLAYRPLSDLSTARKIGRFVDVLNAEMDEDRRGAVQDTSASKRLCTIAAFLLEYEGQVGDFIRSADTRDRLRAAYQVSCNRLLNASGKTGNSSAYDIRSLSVAVIQAVLRHADDKTARRYIDLAAKELREALSSGLEVLEQFFPAFGAFMDAKQAHAVAQVSPERVIVIHRSPDVVTGLVETQIPGVCGRLEACRYAPLSCYPRCMRHPVTPDGKYFVVRGRLWRMSNPSLSEEVRAALTKQLMDARRALRRDAPVEARAEARQSVELAKVALSERGPVWWTDGAPDFNRKMARDTPYAEWFAAQGEVS